MGKLVYVTDVEGPVISPKIDFAWVTLEELIPEDMRSKYIERVKSFDEYDDLRWIHERPLAGHSTGTTPVIAALIASLAGLTNEELLEAAKKYAIETPGASYLINYLKVRGVPIYFITSSAPFVPLTEAYRRSIPSSNVYTMGQELSDEDKVYFDETRNAGMNPLSQEIDKRFPFTGFGHMRPERRLLTEFLDAYLNVCEGMRIEYLKPDPEEKVLTELGRKQFNLLEVVEKESLALAEALRHLLYKEDGIMGAHRKRQVLEEIQKKEGVERKRLVYVGDGIVDADPLKYAGIGISVNCTNEQALLSSDINMAIPNMRRLIPIIGAIRQCETADELTSELELLKKVADCSKTRGRIFLKEDIKADLKGVKSVNREFKNLIKRL